MLLQNSKVGLIPKIQFNSWCLQEAEREHKLVHVGSQKKQRKFRLLLKSLSMKKSVTTDNSQHSLQKRSQTSEKKKLLLPNSLIRMEKGLIKRRKKSLLKNEHVEGEKQLQNLSLLEKLLTIQPTKMLKKQQLDKSYSRHLDYKERMSRFKGNNSFLPGYLPRINRNTNSKRQQYSSQVGC